LCNVILVTTMWGLVDEATGAQRVNELLGQSRYWSGLIARGSQHARFLDTPESGRDIIGLLNGRPPIDTQVQTQMVNEAKSVAETAPGILVNNGLEQLRSDHQRVIVGLNEDHRKALEDGNRELLDQIAKERAEFEQRIAEIEAKSAMLKVKKVWWRRFTDGFVQFITLGYLDTSDWK